MTARAKKLKRNKIMFGLLSTLMWVVTTLVITFATLKLVGDKNSEGMSIFSEEVKSLATSIGVTAIIGIAASIFIKDKIRTFSYMLSLVLATTLYKEVGMYTVLGIWFTDEYIVYALYKRYKWLYEIRKEIDLC